MTNTIRRILVAVDPLQPRDAAFDRALLIARSWNAGLYLLHMRHSERVTALVRSAREAGVQVRVIGAHDDPARAIVAHAHLMMADLIVVARDFGSSRLWRSPRVAAAVARSAPVPVLIVPRRQTAPHNLGTPFGKVVVAVDFTVASAVALRVASEVIAHREGRGTVVHALPYASPLVFSGGEVPGVINDLGSQLAQAQRRLRGAIPEGVSHLVKPRVLTGAPGQAILDVAAEVDADLVVMGVPRRNRVDEVLFGSTFRSVVRRSLRPILAVPVAAGAYPHLRAA